MLMSDPQSVYVCWTGRAIMSDDALLSHAIATGGVINLSNEPVDEVRMVQVAAVAASQGTVTQLPAKLQRWFE
jgi:hypothetical protein